jgi:hypothetical protein
MIDNVDVITKWLDTEMMIENQTKYNRPIDKKISEHKIAQIHNIKYMINNLLKDPEGTKNIVEGTFKMIKDVEEYRKLELSKGVIWYRYEVNKFSDLQRLNNTIIGNKEV